MTLDFAPPSTPPTDPAGEVGELEETYPARPLTDVLEDVVSYNKRFIYHRNQATHDLIALWVAASHGLDKWDYTGRLYIYAPQPGVGKSEQAFVMEPLCPNGYPLVSVSAPGLFQGIDQLGRPTFFIDEADNQFSPYGGKDKADVTAVINGGYRRGSFVLRVRRGDAVRYSTYCAMAIVGIDNGTLPEATRTRCIPVPMVPKPSAAVIEKYRSGQHIDWQDEIRWQLSNAAMDWEVEEPPFSNRQGDLWESLWAVAKAAGGTWPERAARAAEVHQWRHDVPQGKRFLRSVKDWFDQHPSETKVQSTVLAAHVSSYDDLPTMQGKGVAALMKGYDVLPKKRSESWYHLSDLRPVFEQWL